MSVSQSLSAREVANGLTDRAQAAGDPPASARPMDDSPCPVRGTTARPGCTRAGPTYDVVLLAALCRSWAGATNETNCDGQVAELIPGGEVCSAVWLNMKPTSAPAPLLSIVRSAGITTGGVRAIVTAAAKAAPAKAP